MNCPLTGTSSNRVAGAEASPTFPAPSQNMQSLTCQDSTFNANDTTDTLIPSPLILFSYIFHKAVFIHSHPMFKLFA